MGQWRVSGTYPPWPITCKVAKLEVGSSIKIMLKHRIVLRISVINICLSQQLTLTSANGDVDVTFFFGLVKKNLFINYKATKWLSYFSTQELPNKIFSAAVVLGYQWINAIQLQPWSHSHKSLIVQETPFGRPSFRCLCPHCNFCPRQCKYHSNLWGDYYTACDSPFPRHLTAIYQ